MVALHILAAGTVDVLWVSNKETICQRSLTILSAVPAFLLLALPASVSGIPLSAGSPKWCDVYEHNSHAEEMTFSDYRNTNFRQFVFSKVIKMGAKPPVM